MNAWNQTTANIDQEQREHVEDENAALTLIAVLWHIGMFACLLADSLNRTTRGKRNVVNTLS